MKYANDIIAEIKEREPIKNVMYDEQWEHYMRGERIMKTNFDLVKDRSVVMDGDGSMIMPYKIFPTVKDFVDFLNLPVEEKILDDDEKRYIKNIVRPFKNEVTNISKKRYDDKYEYLVINYQDSYDEDKMERRIYLPNFKKDTMYKGMLLNQGYTLAELGITFKN